ncbi:MAG TPA: pitrilysin family protein [Gemmatimonadaceae bacterium]|nr:pitrilysin family protein [Gemmatimonadaceae bacterium]
MSGHLLTPRGLKATILLLTLALSGTEGAAQTARGAAARPTGARAVDGDSGTVAYEVGGIRVVHRLATTSDIVVANLYLLGGVRQVTADNAGIELLLLEASERGTRTYARDRLRRAMARLGTRIVTSAQPDWTSIGLQATRATFDSTWKILTSRVMEPQLDPTDVEILRNQMLAAVRQRQDSPDALVDFLADSFAFGSHPYALPPTGTVASLARLSIEDLRRYHTSQFVKSRMLLVVVGNASRAKVEQLVTQSLARLPAGSYTWTLPDTLPRERAAVLALNRALPTNYILGLYPGPRADSPDYHALRIATAILSGQLFSEVRSRRNLTYAVNAPFIERAIAVGGLYVTTSRPEETIEVIQEEIANLKTGYVDEDALERLIQQFLTQYFLDNESAAEQANFLARAALYEGDHLAATRFEEGLRRVRPQDIRRVTQRYLRDVRFVYLGNVQRAPVGLMERF